METLCVCTGLVHFDCLFQLERSYKQFNDYYTSAHSGRKLNWLYQMCKGDLVTNCFKNKYTFQVRIMLLVFRLVKVYSTLQNVIKKLKEIF